MRVAVQAVPFVIALGLLAILLGTLISALLAIPPLILLLFVLFFFRDPERRPPAGDGLILSPADGRVSAIETGEAGSRISIFLSLFDCHVNRAPVAGRIREARYTPGRYRPAWQSRASSQNERNHLTIDSPGGAYGVTQVAGLLARRIVCTKASGDEVRQGERIGLIQFGSRTDLHLPPGISPLVTVGAHVYGGVTVLAREPGAGENASREEEP
jgi:phosphatidylserine decarboxylase